MLQIFQNVNDRPTLIEWHVGEPMPTITANFVEFTATGDELAVLVDALRQASAVARPPI